MVVLLEFSLFPFFAFLTMRPATLAKALFWSLGGIDQQHNGRSIPDGMFSSLLFPSSNINEFGLFSLLQGLSVCIECWDSIAYAQRIILSIADSPNGKRLSLEERHFFHQLALCIPEQ